MCSPFFATAGAQCREQQRVPLKFTQFMDGRELHEAILREESGGGTLMSTHTSILVDSVGPPSAEVCRTAASFP
jgi:hypothetical protein